MTPPPSRPLSNPSVSEFRAEGAFTQLERLVELHRYAPQLKLNGRRKAGTLQAGEWKTRARGRGIDFEEVRLYQPGDDIRSIDWRVTARSQKPHTKIFTEEQERPVILAADQRSSMFFGTQNCFKSVLCASLLSSLAWAALANRDRVGGIIFGDQSHRDIRPRRSRRTVFEWIRQLHAYNAKLETPCPSSPPQPLSGLLEKLVHITRPGSALYIASDFSDFDESCAKRLYQLSRHGEVTLFFIQDPMELRLPRLDRLWVTDGQKRVTLSGRQQDQPLDQRTRQLDDLCAPLGIPLHRFSTADPMMAGLIRLYGQNGAPRR